MSMGHVNESFHSDTTQMCGMPWSLALHCALWHCGTTALGAAMHFCGAALHCSTAALLRCCAWEQVLHSIVLDISD